LNSHEQVKLNRIRGNINGLNESLAELDRVELQQQTTRDRWRQRLERSRKDIESVADKRGNAEFDAAFSAMDEAERQLKSWETFRGGFLRSNSATPAVVS